MSTSKLWRKYREQAWPKLADKNDKQIANELRKRLGEVKDPNARDLFSHATSWYNSIAIDLIKTKAEPVFCKIIKGRRKGTVAKIVKKIQVLKKGGINDRFSKSKKIIPIKIKLERVELKVEGRPRSWRHNADEIEILDGEQETTFVERDAQLAPLLDVFGKRPELGRFIISASGDCLWLGSVERIMPKTFMIKGKRENGDEWSMRVTDRHEFIVVNEDLTDELLMYKLAM